MTDIIEETPIEETEEIVEEETTEETNEGDEGEEEQEEIIDPEKVSIETREKGEEKIEYGEDIDPEDAKTIGAIVEKQTASVKKQLQDTADRLEVDAFVAEKPEFAKYKPVILKYLQHPVYSKIPVKNIAAMVASNDLLKMGAKKEREAQAKADATKSGGTPTRKQGGGQVDWSKAPKEEFEAHKRRVLGQGN